MTTDILPGIYRHYKGNTYRVIGVGKHSETHEPYVVYEALYDAPLGKLWVRPASMFFEHVTYNGELIQRFTRIDDAHVTHVTESSTRDE